MSLAFYRTPFVVHVTALPWMEREFGADAVRAMVDAGEIIVDGGIQEAELKTNPKDLERRLNLFGPYIAPQEEE